MHMSLMGKNRVCMCGTLRVVGGNVDASDGPHVEEVTKKVHIVWLHRRSRHAHKEDSHGSHWNNATPRSTP